MGAAEAAARLRDEADPRLAAFLLRFFRTGPGDYAEGDRFLGIKVPVIRRIAESHRALPLPEIEKLLRSKIHEDRLLALVVLVEQARRADPAQRLRLFRFYSKHRRHVDNWDLVDVSAPSLVGPFVRTVAAPLVDRWSRSAVLWDRRIGILAHAYEIQAGRVGGFLRFAPRFLADEEDLIHKATGWMLRECGKRDPQRLRRFLDRYRARMPRTMLRYAIERFPPSERRRYLGPPRSPASRKNVARA